MNSAATKYYFIILSLMDAARRKLCTGMPARLSSNGVVALYYNTKSRARALLKTLTIFHPYARENTLSIIIVIMVTIIYILLDLLLAARVRSIVSRSLSVRLEDGRYITYLLQLYSIRSACAAAERSPAATTIITILLPT